MKTSLGAVRVKKYAMGGVVGSDPIDGMSSIQESLRVKSIPQSQELRESEHIKERYRQGHPNTATDAGAERAVNATKLTLFEPGVSQQMRSEMVAEDEAEDGMQKFARGGFVSKKPGRGALRMASRKAMPTRGDRGKAKFPVEQQPMEVQSQNEAIPQDEIQGYAEGGVVSPWSLKGMYNNAKGALQKTPEQVAKDAALSEYKARAETERTQAAAPVQNVQQPTQGIGSYVANTALQAREKAAGLKAGGAIRGKGTGTSDEVPIMASNGEFVIKAKAVKAIGLEVLEALNTIADKPDEKDSKAEAMREYGEGSESETHETAEDAIEGMKCGGKVKKMATGGLINETDPSKTGYGPNTTQGMAARQAVHQAQLANANTLAANNLSRGALPTPAPVAPVAAPVQSDYARQMSEMGASAMRGVGNVGQAAKTAALTAVSAPGYGFNAPAAPAPQGTPAAAAQPVTPVQKPAGALPSTQPSAPTPAQATAVPGGNIPTAPVQAAPMLNGQAGKDVGYGTTRFDVPGKSPLFTNMTDAAGMVSNEKLINRGAISQQNQTAMDNLTARYKAEAVGAAQAQINAERYARESAAADASNRGSAAVTEAISNRDADARAKWDADLTLSTKLGNKEQKVAAQRTLDALNQKANAAAGNAASMDRTMVGDATTRRGQDITAAGQAVQAGALRRTQQIAQDKFGIEQSQEARAAAKDAFDAKQRDRLQAAFDAYDKDPSEKAAERVRVLMGKEKAAPPDSWGIRKVTAADGSVTEIPYNKHTGEDRASQQAKAPPKTGDVVSGHKFKGGNPADQKNWEKV